MAAAAKGYRFQQMSKDHACLRGESKEDGTPGQGGIEDSSQEGHTAAPPINNCQQKGMMSRKVDNKRKI
jgi:hypothetical protein